VSSLSSLSHLWRPRQLEGLPGVARLFTLLPGQIMEVKLHCQMAGQNIQNDFLDLFEILRDPRRLQKGYL